MKAAAFALLAALSAAAGAAEVRIRDYKFVPETVTVKPGATVTWINDEKRASHSILFKEAGVAESERLFQGDRWERRFDRSGTYPYTCGPHPEMKGTVVVTP